MIIIDREPKGNIYNELVDLSSSICSQFILVKRQKFESDEYSDKILEELKPFLKQVKEQNKWPGTISAGTALIYYYQFNDESKEILKKYADGLYSWVDPNLLEDLSFLKDDGTAWLISIAHENFCEINSDDECEISKLKAIDGLIFRKK